MHLKSKGIITEGRQWAETTSAQTLLHKYIFEANIFLPVKHWPFWGTFSHWQGYDRPLVYHRLNHLQCIERPSNIRRLSQHTVDCVCACKIINNINIKCRADIPWSSFHMYETVETKRTVFMMPPELLKLFLSGGLAQMVERPLSMRQVAGLKPTSSPNFSWDKKGFTVSILLPCDCKPRHNELRSYDWRCLQNVIRALC